MKRNIILAVFILSSISTLSYSQDFKNSSWGDSEEHVKKSEGDVDWFPICFSILTRN